ncbi:hypothetical protein [Chitinophaga sp.]|uniref:hypothetical protein n=1 Tax=Chitinophaga sp. TaxID=1869181 RepID=UPI0031DD2310
MSKSSFTITETKGGISVKKKSNTMANLIENDLAFERTRENNAEFGRAGKAASLFLDAFSPILPSHITRGAYPRLQSAFFAALQQDPENERGERQIALGDLEKLRRFELNNAYKLKSYRVQENMALIDRATGILKVNLPAYVPSNFKRPKKSTHLKMTIGGASIDFVNERFTNAFMATDFVRINKTPVEGFSLEVNLEANSVHPLFMLFSIEFHEVMFGKSGRFRNKKYDAVQIVAVSPRP